MNPQMLLRGLGKFLAVVLAAGLAGAVIGIGLAKLSGNEPTSDPVLPVATTATATTTTTQTTAPTTSTATTSKPTGKTSTTSTTAAPADGVYRVPIIKVVAAKLGPTSEVTGRALVAISVRFTSRGNKPLKIKTPVLVSGDDEVPLGDSSREAAGALLEPIAPGATATGVLRFTVTRPVAQRLNDSPAARLRLGNRTVIVKLKPSPPAG